MKKVMCNKFMISSVVLVFLVLLLSSMHTPADASNRPSLSNLEAQLASLQSQISSMETAPLIGEVRLFAGNFAPVGWMLCEGQLLLISENPALFSLLGITYGGNGTTTFTLPDLRGRVAMGAGNGSGLSARTLGEAGGSESTVLTVSQLPGHSHSLNATQTAGNLTAAESNILASLSGGIYKNVAADVVMGSDSIGSTGGGQSVSIVQPYQVLNYIIAIEGVYPPRN